jgi:DNA-directed RNA polymerase subunit M/transcription elongation factor TFIIS
MNGPSFCKHGYDALICQKCEDKFEAEREKFAQLINTTALAQPEQKNHTHEWMHTGAMKGGEYRCVQCGKWGKRNG